MKFLVCVYNIISNVNLGFFCEYGCMEDVIKVFSVVLIFIKFCLDIV